MSALMVLLISSFFVLAAMVGLADALVHFVIWSYGQLRASPDTAETAQAPAQGITA